MLANSGKPLAKAGQFTDDIRRPQDRAPIS